MALVSTPKAAISDAEDIKQISNDVQSIAIDIENPDMILFSRQNTLKRTKENEIIHISSDEVTDQIVGKEETEALNVSDRKGNNMKIISVLQRYSQKVKPDPKLFRPKQF